jgi:hypothetical protein
MLAELAWRVHGMSTVASELLLEASSIMKAEAALVRMGEQINSVNIRCIVRGEGNKCSGHQLASSMKNLYESSIHSSKSSVSGGSSGMGSHWDKLSVAVVVTDLLGSAR